MSAALGEIDDAPGSAAAWAALARVLMIAVFAQSIFAGIFLSGEGWGRAFHRFTAYGLVAMTLAAGIVAVVALARTEVGRRFAFRLVAFGLGLVVQMVLGMLSAEGERLLWLHIPLGVALVGAAAGLEGAARTLRR